MNRIEHGDVLITDMTDGLGTDHEKAAAVSLTVAGAVAALSPAIEHSKRWSAAATPPNAKDGEKSEKPSPAQKVIPVMFMPTCWISA